VCIYLVIKTLGFILPIPAVLAYIFYEVTCAKVLLLLSFFVVLNLLIVFIYLNIIWFKPISLNNVLAWFLKKILFFSLGLVLVLLYIELDCITLVKSVIATCFLEEFFVLASGSNPMSLSNLLNQPSIPSPSPPGPGGPSGNGVPVGLPPQQSGEQSTNTGGSTTNSDENSTTIDQETVNLKAKYADLARSLETQVDSLLMARSEENGGENRFRSARWEKDKLIRPFEKITLREAGLTYNDVDKLDLLSKFAESNKDKYRNFYTAMSGKSVTRKLNAQIYGTIMKKSIIHELSNYDGK